VHALGEYLDRELTERGWKPAQFAKRAKLSRQNVYQLLDADRTVLKRLPLQRTAQALADGLSVSVEVIWGKALESLPPGMVQPRDEVRDYLARPEDVPNEVLMELLEARLFHRADNGVDPEVVNLRALRTRAEDLLVAAEQGATITVVDLRRLVEGTDDG
jgi:transcriptional regulator with XRE-family HTH domain